MLGSRGVGYGLECRLCGIIFLCFRLGDCGGSGGGVRHDNIIVCIVKGGSLVGYHTGYNFSIKLLARGRID